MTVINVFRKMSIAGVGVAMMALLLAAPDTANAEARGVPPGLAKMKDPIEGVWNVKVDIRVCGTPILLASFDAMSAYASNGIFHDTNSTNPALRSAGFGTWTATGHRTYETAFRFFRVDAMGSALGSNLVRLRTELAEDGRTFFSEGTGEIIDPAGFVLSTVCPVATGERFH